MSTSLKVIHNGQELQSLELVKEQTYTIGRHQDCDIIIEAPSGISRKHLEVYHDGTTWMVKNLSKAKNLIFNDDIVEMIMLENGDRFSVKEFEFEFSQSTDSAELEAHESMDKTQPITTWDQTSVGQISLQPRLKITTPGQPEKTYALKAQTCVVGRDESCDVPVDAPKMSRRHFEIMRNDDGSFSIMDLGSSNGTYLNGKAINKNSYTKIKSGDVIEASGAKMIFEVVDSEFSNRISNLPAINTQQQQPQGSPMSLPMPAEHLGAKVVKIDKTQRAGISLSQTPKKKLVIYSSMALSIILVASLFSGDPVKKNEPMQKTELASKEVSFEKLTPEEKAVVRDTFNLARSHYMQGRYGLCKAEISKLHDVVPFYENSKELQNLCGQALELEKIAEDRDRKNQERERIEQRIQIVTSECRQKIDKFSNEAELNVCLQPAIEFDPQHPLITELVTLLQAKEQEKQAKLARKKARNKRIKQGENKYYSARKLYNKEQYAKAIRALNKYLNGSWPDPKGLKSKARRDLASAKTKLSELVDKEFNICKTFQGDKKLKEAIIACDKALEQDPNNQDVLDFRAETLSALRKEMKFIYEDSILEESLGNVEAAKEKWKTILQKNIKSDEYYRKAKSKLKKYGIGI